MTKRDLNGNWDQTVTEADVLAFLEGKIAKFSKKTLRDEYAGTLMPG